MAIVARDLIVPLGELKQEYYPDEDASNFEDRVTSYLSDASAKVSQSGISGDAADRATKAWVYYRGFSDILNRLIVSPSSADVKDSTSISYSVAQLRILEARVEAYRLAFESEVPATSGDVTSGRLLPPSASIPLKVAW